MRIFHTTEEASLGLCCDNNKNRIDSLRKSFPKLAFTLDYNSVINNKNIDAVVVATPTVTHYELVKVALKKGKHVLCEKPLAINKEESEELFSLAQKKKRVLMVGYVFLFNNGIIALKEIIEKNKLGKIYYLHFTRTNLGPIRHDVDVIYDLASHDIAIASFLLRRWPRGVSASAGFFLRKKISDIGFINLYYPENIFVNIHVSWLDPRKVRKITCVGNKKMAIWDDLDTSEPVRIFNKGVIKEPFYSDYGEFQLLPREGEVTSPLLKLSEPLKKQNNHFLECIKQRKRPLTDVEFSQNVNKVLEAIQLSIRNEGRIQKVL